MIGSYPIKTDLDLKAMPVTNITSSREERYLPRTHNPDVKTYAVKAIRCHGYVEAIKKVGSFWGVVDRPPVRGEWRR